MRSPVVLARSPLGLTLLPNQYPALHGLRVLGILGVIQIHLGFELGVRGLLPAAVQTVTQRLWFAMDLFFVLSGFLIGNILLASEDSLGSRRILRFYARRSFRIVPLYYVVLTLLAFYRPLEPLTRANLYREYLYLTNYTDTAHVVMFWGWSLCVEEHFYLAVPFVIIALRWFRTHRGRLAFLVALWLSALAVRWLIVYGPHEAIGPKAYFRYVYIATHTRYDTLVAGIFLAYLHRHFGAALARQMERPRARRSVLLAGVLVLIALMYPPQFVPALVWNIAAIGTVSGLGWVLVILPLLRDGLPSRVLGASPFLRFATLGYGVYLVHMPLVLSIGIPTYRALSRRVPAAPAFVLAVATTFAVALAIAYVLHLVVEKPMLKLRDALVAQEKRPAAQ